MTPTQNQPCCCGGVPGAGCMFDVTFTLDWPGPDDYDLYVARSDQFPPDPTTSWTICWYFFPENAFLSLNVDALADNDGAHGVEGYRYPPEIIQSSYTETTSTELRVWYNLFRIWPSPPGDPGTVHTNKNIVRVRNFGDKKLYVNWYVSDNWIVILPIGSTLGTDPREVIGEWIDDTDGFSQAPGATHVDESVAANDYEAGPLLYVWCEDDPLFPGLPDLP